MKAVIDRFEGDLAVLILSDDEKRLNIPREVLPPKAKEGSWLTLDIIGGEPRNIKFDPQQTETTRQHGARVGHHDAEGLAIAAVPQACGLVGADRQQQLGAQTEHRGVNRGRMGHGFAQRLATVDAPQPGLEVVAPGGDDIA